MYIESTDQVVVAFALCEDGTTSHHSARIITDHALYTHTISFDTTAEAQYLVDRIIKAGEIDPEFWDVAHHGIEDTNLAYEGAEACARCDSSGKYIVGTENGRPKFGGGICYRCEGKGHHTQADRARNDSHDAHFIMRSA